MNEISVVDHEGQRVLTTEQLAQAYGCEGSRISENFKRNEDRFIIGQHYFKLDGEELKDFRLRSANCGLQISSMTRSLYLWTRRGASRHCKMLGTDQAWEMFDQLEETYFNVSSKPALPHDYISALEALVTTAKQVITLQDKVEQDKPYTSLGYAVSDTSDVITLLQLSRFLKQSGCNVGRTRLYQLLRDDGLICRESRLPTQRAMEMKLFYVKESVFIDSNGESHLSHTPYVTGKGQRYFIEKYTARQSA